MEERLKTREADIAPKDGQLELREWRDFSVREVPQLRRESDGGPLAGEAAAPDSPR